MLTGSKELQVHGSTDISRSGCESFNSSSIPAVALEKLLEFL